jgi:hypothetical protein
MADRVAVRLDFFDKALFLELGDDLLARLEPILAAIALDPFARLAAAGK